MKIVALTPDRKLDAICSVIIEGMNDYGVEVIASDPGNSVINYYSDEEVIQHSKDADYIFAFFGKVRGNRSPKYYLLNEINRPDVTAYIDGSEWTATGYPDGDKVVSAPWGNVNSQVYESKFDPKRCKGTPWINDQMYAYCRWYFKRECYPEDKKIGLIPLNVGCQNKFFGGYDLKKDIDVFCSFGQLNNGYRYEIVRSCERLRDEGYNVIIAKGLEYQEYLKLINRSYISISSWGAGNSCMRLYENMANASCCFAQRTEIKFIDKPEDGYHYVEYSSMEEFERKLRSYLVNKEKCIDVGRRGLDFVSQKHTGRARFSYMLEQISKNE
jgi:hypothetical protein